MTGHEPWADRGAEPGVRGMSADPPRPIPAPLTELVAGRFRVLSHPARVWLIDYLEWHGETNVQALADELGATQQNASRHLGLLVQAGLLDRRREGRVVWYRLADTGAFALIHTSAADILGELGALDHPGG